MKKNNESVEQFEFLLWCKNNGVPVAATPNETPAGHMENSQWKTHWKSVSDAKMKGVSAGFPDLTVVCPCGDGNNRVVFIEMKAPGEKPKIAMDVYDEKNWINKDGTIKKTCAGVKRAQILWLRIMDTAKDVGSYICYSAEEAKDVIKAHIRQKEF